MDYTNLSLKDFYFLNYRIFQTAQQIRVEHDFETWTKKIENEILMQNFEPFQKKYIEFSFFENECVKLSNELISKS